jgi:hypothetical protein
MDLSISATITKIASAINEGTKDEEQRKRFFILECRHNLGVLNIASWKGNSAEMKYHVLMHLNSEICENLLKHFKNNIFHFTTDAINKLFVDEDEEQFEGKDLFIKIITKIQMIKIIAGLPENLRVFDNANIEKRIENLRNNLISILKEIN